MKNIDDLLNGVKENSDWKSDYAIGRGLGYTNSAQVNGWKRRAAMPSIEDIITMADHANLNLEEAVRAVAYSKLNERPVKQAGFGNVVFLSALGVSTIGAMTLLKMSALPYEALTTSFFVAGNCILCKIKS